MWAAEMGHGDDVKYLHQAGADIRVREAESEVEKEMNNHKSEDMMSDTELPIPRNTLPEDGDGETKLQEVDGKITMKMEELAALHKERMQISGKKRHDS